MGRPPRTRTPSISKAKTNESATEEGETGDEGVAMLVTLSLELSDASSGEPGIEGLGVPVEALNCFFASATCSKKVASCLGVAMVVDFR